MREGALVLLCFPVEVEGTNGGEGRGDAVQDDEVNVVAEIDPDGDEQAEVGGYQGGVYVGEGFGGLFCFGFPISIVHAQDWGRRNCTSQGKKWGLGRAYREEKITDIMRDVNRQPHVGEMKPIAQPDQRQGDDVMSNKLPVISTWFFEPETENQGLLGPITRLQQIVGLEKSLVGSIRKRLVHAGGVEIPNRGAIHDIQAIGTRNTEVDGGVHLFHEAILLRAGAKMEPAGEGPEDALHDKLAGKGEDDNVESDKSEIFAALAIVDGRIGVGANSDGN